MLIVIVVALCAVWCWGWMCVQAAPAEEGPGEDYFPLLLDEYMLQPPPVAR
jgi:hypothetical protein